MHAPRRGSATAGRRPRAATAAAAAGGGGASATTTTGGGGASATTTTGRGGAPTTGGGSGLITLLRMNEGVKRRERGKQQTTASARVHRCTHRKEATGTRGHPRFRKARGASLMPRPHVTQPQTQPHGAPASNAVSAQHTPCTRGSSFHRGRRRGCCPACGWHLPSPRGRCTQ